MFVRRFNGNLFDHTHAVICSTTNAMIYDKPLTYVGQQKIRAVFTVRKSGTEATAKSLGAYVRNVQGKSTGQLTDDVT